MVNRFEQKPDPAIKKNVIRSRKTARSSGAAKGFVVAASLAATLSGWALFSYGDAQNAANVQSTDATQIVASSTVQQATITATPMVTTVQQATSTNSSPQVSLASQINNQAAATATATATATQAAATATVAATSTATATATTTTAKATATPQVVASTKSSR
jgi:hypothetical protein